MAIMNYKACRADPFVRTFAADVDSLPRYPIGIRGGSMWTA